MFHWSIRGLCFAFCLLAGAAQAVTVLVSEKGVGITAGTLGQVLVNPPVLVDTANNEAKPVEQTLLGGGTARFSYAGGGVIEIAQAGGQVTLTLKTIPAEQVKFRMDALLPFTLAQGGKWGVDAGALQSFPETFPGKPFLFQGNAGRFTCVDLQGQGFSLSLPQYSYQQLQDNRQWGWKIFAWHFQAPILKGVAVYTLSITDADAKTGPVVLADEFGQNPRADFPNKLNSVAELRADVEADTAYYAGLTPPATDPYGGLPGSKGKLALRQTGFFHVEQQGTRWLLVDPAGNAFFHLGLCSALNSGDDYTHVAGREALFAWLPPYNSDYRTAYRPDDQRDFSFYIANLIKKYGQPYDRDAWSGRMIDRYRKWGFNSVGAFSAPTATSEAKRFPYVLTLPLGVWDGNMRSYQLPRVRGLIDPFNPDAVAEFDRLCAARVAAKADDPLLIGYFLENEQAFEDLPKVLPTLTGNLPAKARLVQMLTEKYRTIDAFNTAWKLKADSFDALQHTGLAVSTRAAYDDMQAYTALFLDTYYRMIAATFHKYDTHHLLLGNRWMPSTANNQALCHAAGQYLDVVSINYYADGIDADYLRKMDAWCGGKPMLLSEFHFSSPKESGLPGGHGDLASQQARGLAYRNYVEGAAALGFVVGIEWFSALDQAYTSRFFDTENGNIGLLSVADRPYKPMLAEMMKTNYGIYPVLFGQRPPFVLDDPRFSSGGTARRVVKAPRALPGLALDGTKTGWPGTPPEVIPGDRVVIGSQAAGFDGAFRLCYDDTDLYLMAEVHDSTPMQNSYTGNMIWSADALEVFLGAEHPEQPGPLQFTDRQLMLSAAKGPEGYHWYYANAPQQYPCRMLVVPMADRSGYLLEAAIPFAALGITPKAGMQLLFDLAIDDSADGKLRLRQLMWNGIARNSSDRSHWGRLVLVQ